nr:putative cell-to-cell movement protein [alfalfa-associated nucleorhabdovirus]
MTAPRTMNDKKKDTLLPTKKRTSQDKYNFRSTESLYAEPYNKIIRTKDCLLPQRTLMWFLSLTDQSIETRIEKIKITWHPSVLPDPKKKIHIMIKDREEYSVHSSAIYSNGDNTVLHAVGLLSEMVCVEWSPCHSYILERNDRTILPWVVRIEHDQRSVLEDGVSFGTVEITGVIHCARSHKGVPRTIPFSEPRVLGSNINFPYYSPCFIGRGARSNYKRIGVSNCQEDAFEKEIMPYLPKDISPKGLWKLKCLITDQDKRDIISCITSCRYDRGTMNCNCDRVISTKLLTIRGSFLTPYIEWDQVVHDITTDKQSPYDLPT